jgi:hypothetical protein
MSQFEFNDQVIRFVEQNLRSHRKVIDFERTDDVFFTITRTPPLPTVYAVVLDRYRVGLAAVYEALEAFPKANCIVIVSGWNRYTKEAKEHGIRQRVGIFKLGEFLGALNYAELHRYMKKGKNGTPITPDYASEKDT